MNLIRLLFGFFDFTNKSIQLFSFHLNILSKRQIFVFNILVQLLTIL